MKKFLAFALLVSLAVVTYAQDEYYAVPDYKQIKQNVTDMTSTFYYPNLFKRFKAGDETLTLEEKRHIYYGFVFQKGYSPTENNSSYNKDLVVTLKKNVLSDEDYNKILKCADNLLQEDPFNLRAINAKLLVYSKTNDITNYKKVAAMRNVIQNAIVSTGDGMTVKTGYYVIKVAHEYDLLGFLGFRFGGDNKIEKRCNYLTVEKNQFGVDKLYFEISPVLDYASSHSKGKL